MSEERTEISSLGEFGLIDHLTRNIELQNASSLLGVGDDAAVLDHFGKQTVITTDLLVEGGDTTSSQKGFIISITAIGEVAPDKYVKRSTAAKGDLICVSGDLGGAY